MAWLQSPSQPAPASDVTPTRLRRRRDEGATLLEAALAVPLLLALVFGIIDFGNAYNNWMSLRQGTRKGMRMAVVNTNPPNPAGGAWSCPVVGSSAPAAGTDAYNLICYIKKQIGLNGTNVRVSIYFDPPFQGPNKVKICTQANLTSVTGAYGPILRNKVVTTETESIIENSSDGLTATVQETPLTSWASSCRKL